MAKAITIDPTSNVSLIVSWYPPLFSSKLSLQDGLIRFGRLRQLEAHKTW